jgi:chromosome segregation ATPase
MRRLFVTGGFVVGVIVAWATWQANHVLMATERELKDQRRDIGRAEAEIVALEHSIDETQRRIRALAAEIDAIETAHPDGIPRDVHPRYQDLVSRHNDLAAEHNRLVARHDALRASYAERVDKHNARVEAANEAVPGWLRPRDEDR